jgi:hypothetical protein
MRKILGDASPRNSYASLGPLLGALQVKIV